MAHHPRHQDPDDQAGAWPAQEPPTSTPWATYAFVAVSIVVVLGVVVLHLAGVIGPGAH